MPTAAEKAREKLMAQFAKSYGENTMTIKEKNDYQAISTGSIALDRAMGSGGYILGRICELYGPQAGGKSSLSLIAAANAQLQFPDKMVAYIDIEHTFDPEWARKLGADPSKILHIDPLTAENVADMAKDAIMSDVVSLLIYDSVGAVLTKREFEKAADESDMGKRAQVMSRMINIVTGLAPRHDVAVIILNQLRANFGFGGDTKSSGGFAQGHADTHKLQVKRASAPVTIGAEDEKVNVGYEMGVRIEKNKVAAEGRNVKFDFYIQDTTIKGVRHPIGVDKVQEAFNIGVRDGVIIKGGSWYTLPNGEKINSGDATKEYLGNNPDQVAEIRKLIMEKEAPIELDTLPDLTPEQAQEAGII